MFVLFHVILFNALAFNFAYVRTLTTCVCSMTRDHATLVFHVRVCYEKYVCYITSCEFPTLSDAKSTYRSLHFLLSPGRQTIGLLSLSSSCDVKKSTTALQPIGPCNFSCPPVADYRSSNILRPFSSCDVGSL